MRKLFLSLIFVVAGLLTASAATTGTDVVFDFSTEAGVTELGLAVPAQGQGTNIKDNGTFSKDGVIFTSIQSGSTSTRVYNSKGKLDFRFYAGSKFSLTAPAGKSISQVKLDATVTAPAEILPAAVATFEPGKKTIKSITVTLVESSGPAPTVVAAPTFTPNGGNFSAATDVTIATATADATISYTVNYIDGTTAAAADQASPVTVNLAKSATITATAKASDGTVSNEATSESFFITLPGEGGNGTLENPYTVEQLMAGFATAPTGEIWVKGYIVGCLNGSVTKPQFSNFTVASNLLIAPNADVNDVDLCRPVKLSSGAIRDALNLKENPLNVGKEVLLKGTLVKYFGIENSLEAISDYQFVGDIATPVINPNGGVFFADETTLPIAVTITGVEGSTLKYWFDTQAPVTTTANTVTVNVDKTCTLSAIAVLNGLESATVSSDFSIHSSRYTVLNSVSEVFPLAVGDSVKTAKDLKVIYQNGKNLYVKDNEGTGFMLLYGQLTNTYNPGDVIAAGLKAEVGEYGKVKQLKPNDASMPAGVAATPVEPALVNAKTVLDLNPYYYQYVKMEQVKVVADPKDTKNRNFFIVDLNNDTIKGYDNFNLTLTVDAAKVYNLVGIAGEFNAKKQVNIISVEEYVAPAPVYPEVLYVIGNLPEHNWDANCVDFKLAQSAETPGVYTGTVTIVPSAAGAETGYFKIIEKTGADWGNYSYAGKNDGDILALDTPTQIWGGAPAGNNNAFQIKADEVYEFTVDFTNADNKTITAKCVTPAPEPGVTEPTLTQIAKFTEGLPATNEARQGTYANGAMNIYDKSNGQYTVWNEKGLVNTVTTDAAVANTGITADEAGNIIFTDKVFPGAATPTKLIVYPADGSEMVTIDLTGVPSVGRVDYYSKVRGNILSGEAMMFLPVNGSAAFVVLPFYDGVLDADNVSTIAVANAAVADNGTIIYAVNEDENGNIDVIYNKRNGGVSKITIAAGLEGGYNLVDDTYVVSATGRNAANGCDAFKLGKKQYILYPSQTNYRDGFSIAELNNAENNPEVVTFKETYTKNPNGIQANWVFAQVINETTAKIFQYVPGGYVAIYKFQVPAEVTPEPTPTYPAKLYVVGNIPDHSWDGNYDGAALEPVVEAPGTFKGTVTLVQAAADNTNAYFRLTSKPGADWDKYSYAGKSNNQLIALETPTQIWGGEPNGNSNAFMIEGGKAYEMVVDLTDSNNMTLRVTESTSSVNGVDAEAVMVIAGVGEINIIGNAANVAVYNLSGALVSANETTVNCPAGIYLVNVDGKVVKVLVK